MAERRTHWGYSYCVRPDASVEGKQKFYWFHVPDWADNSGASTWLPDRDGRLYAATRMGAQVFDRNGRSRAILPGPAGEVTGLCFGGEKFNVLYVACGEQVFRRRLKTAGTRPGAAPMKLPGWGAG